MSSSTKVSLRSLEFHPFTTKRWIDFERLFGKRGACGGCWCMWWRMKRSEFETRKGAANKRAMRRIVSAGEVPGILAYARANGARIIEGYPVEPKKGTTADAFVWTGTAAAFRKAGFREVLRRSDTRPIMRRNVRPVT